MACRITELILDCRDPETLADFWCQVLDYVVLETDEDGGIEIGPAGNDPADPGLTIVLSPSTDPRQAKLPSTSTSTRSTATRTRNSSASSPSAPARPTWAKPARSPGTSWPTPKATSSASSAEQ